MLRGIQSATVSLIAAVALVACGNSPDGPAGVGGHRAQAAGSGVEGATATSTWAAPAPPAPAPAAASYLARPQMAYRMPSSAPRMQPLPVERERYDKIGGNPLTSSPP